MAGRPTKFSKEVYLQIAYGISKGQPIELSCKAAGVSYDAYNEWMKKEGEEYDEFRHVIKKAEGQRSLYWLEMLDKAIDEGTWQAACWKLERIHPEYFGKDVTQLQELLAIMKEIRQSKGLQNG